MTYGRAPLLVVPNLSSYTPLCPSFPPFVCVAAVEIIISQVDERRESRSVVVVVVRGPFGPEDGRDIQSANNARGARGTSLSSLFILVQIPGPSLSVEIFSPACVTREEREMADERPLLYSFDFTNSLIPLFGTCFVLISRLFTFDFLFTCSVNSLRLDRFPLLTISVSLALPRSACP